MELSFFSIIPPVIIIIMIIATKRIVLSLGTGIIAGALIVHNWNIIHAVKALFFAIVGLFYSDGSWNSGNFYIVSFLLLLGVITGIISALGGNLAFGEWLGRRIQTKRGAQLMTAVSGVTLFPDDVFNMFVTSRIAAPIIDHVKVPRTKLAYILHSTSDPTCVLCPLSSWGAYIIAILSTIFASLQLDNSPLISFMIIATTNFYALSTLLFVFSSSAFDINLGKMKTVIPKTQILHNEHTAKGTIWDLLLPIILLVLGAVSTMLITGYVNSDVASIMNIFSNSEVSFSLVTGSILATICCFILFSKKVIEKKQQFSNMSSILKNGMKTTLPAVEILLFAWLLSDFIGQLGTGEYLAQLINQITLPIAFLPFLMFLITGAMAFSTGTSWGTFAIMLPIAAQIAEASDPSIMLFLMSAVLSGSLFGDHCSPVSDTTTVASAAAGCTQIEHVATQLPYALLCAAITAMSFLLLGFSGTRWLPYLFILAIIGSIILWSTRTQKTQNTSESEAA